MAGGTNHLGAVVLRPATAEDHACFARLFAEMRGLDGLALPEADRDAMVHRQLELQYDAFRHEYPGLERLAIVVDGDTVGRLDRWESPDQVRLVELVVAAGARGRGIGTAALREALDHAGGRRTTLAVDVSNTDARRLYERLGFRAVGGAVADDDLSLEMEHP